MKDCFQKILFALFFLLLASQVVWAAEQGRQLRFQDASSSYSRGEYTRAIQGFEALVHEGVSAPLFYNLANSYAQAGQSGRAILNYERALRLAPGDSDIRGNLELVRKDKGLFQEEQTFGQRFVDFLGLNQWVVLAAATLVLFAVVLLLPASVTLKRSSRYGFAVACLLINITAITSASVLYQHWHDGVVVVADTRLRVSPFESAASVGVIQEGRLVTPGKSHNEYILVTDETGRSGWLSSDAFERIGGLE